MARTKQTARKSTSFTPWSQWGNNTSYNANSLSNNWNKINKEQDNDPNSFERFGCMQRGSSSRFSFHEQQQQQLPDPSIHLKSSFNAINTVSPLPKSTWPVNTNMNVISKPVPQRKKVKRKSTKKSKKSTTFSNNNTSTSFSSGNYNTNTMNLGKRKKKQYVSNYGYNNNNNNTYKRRQSLKQSKIVMKEIKKYQNSTNLLLPKATFGRLVREIAMEYKVDLRFSTTALEALQQATEWYITRVLKDTNLCALHTHRINIEVKDMQLARRIRANKETQYTF